MAPVIDFTQFRAEDGSHTKRRTQGIYTGPAAYVTGGDPFTPGDVKLGQIDILDFTTAADSPFTTAYSLVYDPVNQKVIWLVQTTGLQVANGVALNAASARFEAIGR
jgi:hypothetical protein